MAAATSSSVLPYVIGAAVVEPSRNIRTLAPSLVLRISGKSNGLSIRNDRDLPSTKTEGPSCLFIGPIESASKETLEALYRQARDAYYSGKPLIVDDMFDRVELKLRWYGSKYVVKYPRCSLRRQSTYADAEEDPSQVFALAGVWFLFLAFGSSACLVPLIYTIRQAYKDVVDAGFYPGSHSMEFFAMLNAMLFIMLGTIIGYPVASASAGALQGLRKNDLMALKGACPNCGEEVFAFVKSNQFNNSIQKAECHVCECLLEFHTKIEQSISRPDKRLVYGRIYLIRRRGRGRRQGGREGFFV